MACLGLILAGCCLPWVPIGLMLMEPVPQPVPLPASWQPECGPLDAVWSLPQSREIGYEQLIISPWLLTAHGPLFIAAGEREVRFERWRDSALVSSYPTGEFYCYTGTSHGDAVALIGKQHNGPPQVRLLHPETLTEQQVTDIPPAVLPQAEFHGVDLVPSPDGRLALLLEAKTESAIQKRSEGLAPVRFCWFDPLTAAASPIVTCPFSAELPDYALYQRSPIPTYKTSWIASGVLRLRPVDSGESPIATVQVATGELTGPASWPEMQAAERATRAWQGDRHYHRSWTQALHQPPVAVSLDATGYLEPAWISTGMPTLDDIWLVLRAKIDEQRGGTELQIRQFLEGVTITGLQLHHPAAIDSPLAITDRSLTEALQHELGLPAAAPYAFAGWDENTLLFLHVVLYPPAGLNGGGPILRLASIDTGTGALTWHGWVPFPKEFQERILTLERWRIAVFGGTLVLTVHQASTVERFPEYKKYPPLTFAAQVALPASLRTSWYGELECSY